MPDLVAGTSVTIAVPIFPAVTVPVLAQTQVTLAASMVAGSSVVVAVPTFPVAAVAVTPVSTVLVAPVAGPAGLAGRVVEHVQVTASASWLIVHNLNRRPVVAVWVDGQLGLADVEALDANTVVVTFPAATTGIASLV